MNSDTSSEAESISTATGYKIGAFSLYLGPKILTLNGEEISLEPKVFDVLAYLCANHSHYVSIQELHENVWLGRVVSDAAVRRSVSKLRFILALDEEQEQYIKSAHKRGYILDCDVSVLDDAEPTLTRSSSAKLKVGKNNWYKKQKFGIAAATIITAFFLSYLWWGDVQFNSPLASVNSAQTNIIDYPGEKSHVAMSKDEKRLAFAGKVVSYQGYQLFIKDLVSKEIQQLTFDENNVVRLAFSADQEHLVYIDMTPGQSKLKQIALGKGGLKEQAQILVDDFFILSDLAIVPDGSGIVFNGMQDKTLTSQTFFYEFATQQVKELVTDFSANAHDYKVALSQNGEHLAVVTTLNYPDEQRITIYNMENRKVLNRFYHDKHVFEMKWLDDQSILLLDDHCISKIEFDTGKKELVKLNDRKRMRSFEVLDSGELVALKQTNAGTLFLEVDSNGFNLSSQNIIAHNDDTLEQAVFFGDANAKLYLRKKDEAYRLTVTNNDGQHETEILTTSLELQVLDVADDASEILITLDGLLALLDVKSNEITYIESDPQALFFDGVLSSQDRAVFYGVKTRNDWSIKRYDRVIGERQIVANGFKSAREYSNGFVLINEDGEFYTSDSQFANITPLKQAVLLDSGTLWFVRNDVLFWSEFNGNSISFSTLNLNDGRKDIAKFDGSQFSTQFDIDPSGQRALLKGLKFPETQVTMLDLEL